MTDRVENVYSNIDPLTGSVATSASDRGMQTRAEYSKMASSSGYLPHTVGSMEWRPPGGGWKKKVAHLGKWEFILKILEIVLLSICAGLYTDEIHKIRNTSGTMIFPIVIYISFLIITFCITICYAAKRGLTDLFAVIYQSLAVLLLFASGGVVMSVYLGLGSKVRAYYYWEAIGIVIQTVFSFLAALVYLADLALSLNSLNAVNRH